MTSSTESSFHAFFLCFILQKERSGFLAKKFRLSLQEKEELSNKKNHSYCNKSSDIKVEYYYKCLSTKRLKTNIANDML